MSQASESTSSPVSEPASIETSIETVFELLRAGLCVRFRAKGQSMRPFIRDGDVLTLEPVGSRRPRRGDVVLGRTQANQIICHRILCANSSASGQVFCLRGDALSGPMETVLAGDVAGRALSRTREGRMTELTSSFSRISGLLWALAKAIMAPLTIRLGRWRPRIWNSGTQ